MDEIQNLFIYYSACFSKYFPELGFYCNEREFQIHGIVRRYSDVTGVSRDGSYFLIEMQKEYLKAQSVTFKQSTVKRNQIITSSVIDLLGADAIVDNLTTQFVNSRLLGSGKQVSTLNTYITRFKALLNWGYINDYHNNMKLIAKLKPFVDPADDKEITSKYLEPAEAQKLLDYIKQDKSWHWYYATSILILTG